MKLIVKAKIKKNGGSNYIIIPKAILESLGKNIGDEIVLEIKK